MSVGKVNEFDVASGAWSSYVDRLEMYFLVNDVDDSLRLPTLIAVMGNEAYELLANLASPKKPSELDYDAAVTLLRNHLEATPSALAERYRFRQRRQVVGENIAGYVAELKKLARNCKFGSNLNENLRDQFVCGIRSEVIRQRLFAEEDTLTYANAVKIASSLEAAERDAAAVETPTGGSVTAAGGPQVQAVHAVQVGYGGGTRWRGARGRRSTSRGGVGAAGRGGAPRVTNVVGARSADRGLRHCLRCGATSHDYNNCRFRNYECSRCGRTGHLRRVCPESTGAGGQSSGRGAGGGEAAWRGRGTHNNADFHYGEASRAAGEPAEDADYYDDEPGEAFHHLCLNDYRAARCIVCHLTFCCSDCRWKHEQTTHNLQFDCTICRGFQYLCKPKDLTPPFVEHLKKEHLPLYCLKCNKVFSSMEDFATIDECTSISELLDKDNALKEESAIEGKFNSIFEKVYNDNMEAGTTVTNKNKTAVITPIVRKKYLVDYESSEGEDEVQEMKTPHNKIVPKTPRCKIRRAMTPHVKKFMLVRQKAVEELEDTDDDVNDEQSAERDETPLRNQNLEAPDTEKQMTTPTSHVQYLAKLTQAVTTSTPTHPEVGGWSMFNDQGADSPLSEIENGESPATSIINEQSKVESSSAAPKLKSIIVTGSRIRLGSQDSSEKQVTWQESVETLERIKKVKFAEDTVFEQEPKIKRVYRKPRRMLTPGPQRPKHCCNPRFQALINRFEHHGKTLARTPVNPPRKTDETPPIGEHTNMPARAINFKEDSPVIEPENCSKESNELFKTCVESPTASINNAITALTANIAGSLHECVASALNTREEETEIQFKFVITKKKVVKGLAENNFGTIVEGNKDNKETIWSSVAKAVKTVFWGEGTNLDSTTPHRSYHSDSSSASKRKCDELSDNESPLNHKRHKYEGRIRGRPPLRSNTWVSSLRSTHSAEQSGLEQRVTTDCDDGLNQSF